MNGTIEFQSWKELAEFLKHFADATATFEVVKIGEKIILRFTGGF